MQFDDLPENVKDIVDGHESGEFPFRPRPSSNEDESYLWLRQADVRGVLDGCMLLKPNLRDGSCRAKGKGFGWWSNQIVVTDIREWEDADNFFPIDPQLDFYRYDQMSSYAATPTALKILRGAGCGVGDMARPVFQLTDHGVDATELSVVDFPCEQVIDYSRSAANWNVYTFIPEGQSEPKRIYFPNLVLLTGSIHVRRDTDFQCGVVRDSIHEHLAFVRRDVLRDMNEAGVTGPNYSDLAK